MIISNGLVYRTIWSPNVFISYSKGLQNAFNLAVCVSSSNLSVFSFYCWFICFVKILPASDGQWWEEKSMYWYSNSPNLINPIFFLTLYCCYPSVRVKLFQFTANKTRRWEIYLGALVYNKKKNHKRYILKIIITYNSLWFDSSCTKITYHTNKV